MVLDETCSPPRKLLFVCSRNKRRSLTAEKLFAGDPSYHARSAGTQPGARVPVTPGIIGWADVIFVMEKAHAARLHLRFAEELAEKPMITLHIPDDYEYLQPELIEELRAKLEQYVEVPE